MNARTPTAAAAVASLVPYITQKRVLAAKVLDVQFDPGTAFLVLEGGKSVEVGLDWLHKRVPSNSNGRGGYYVLYPDGYSSWSPAEAFEESATPEAEYGLPLAQEPKYTVGARGRLVNRQTGNPITEPIMILRAQDRLAYEAVLRYRDHANDAEGTADSIREGAAERLAAFANFALENPYRMKEPT